MGEFCPIKGSKIMSKICNPQTTKTSMLSSFINPVLTMIPNILLDNLWLLILLPLLIYLLYPSKTTNGALPWNWPLVGMTPLMLYNLFRDMHSTISEGLENYGGTFLFKGIWFTNMYNVLATSDPENVRHIMNKTSTYIKGPEWRDQFDIFGKNSIFNQDFEAWKQQRKIFHAFLSHQEFHHFLAKVVPKHIEEGLMPLLDHVVKHEMVVDLQDLFKRYTFGLATILTVGCNSESLSITFPKVPFSEAMEDAWEAAFFRYLLPERLWKLQRWVQIGSEKRLSRAKSVFDGIFANYISMQRQQREELDEGTDDEDFNFLKCYLLGHEVTGPTPRDEVIRDGLLLMMFAIEDTASSTLTWFFWILSKNPSSLKKIREEINSVLTLKDYDGKLRLLSSLDEVNKLIYLHAALCESLRLFPPGSFEARISESSDILPSGHHVYKKMRIVVCALAMGRMSSVWGEDCHEFKPERWITEEGKIKREPPHKFFAFASGPRICLGKDIAFTFIKATVASVLLNYNVEVLQGQKATPKRSLMLRMENGLKARISRN